MSNYKIVHLYVQCHFTPSPLGRRSRAESRPKADISASQHKSRLMLKIVYLRIYKIGPDHLQLIILLSSDKKKCFMEDFKIIWGKLWA